MKNAAILVSLLGFLVVALGVAWQVTRQSGVPATSGSSPAAVVPTMPEKSPDAESTLPPSNLPSKPASHLPTANNRPMVPPAAATGGPATAASSSATAAPISSSSRSGRSPGAVSGTAVGRTSTASTPKNPTSNPAAPAGTDDIVIEAQVPVATSLPPEVFAALPVEEQSALQTAQKAFQEQLAEYGPLDPNSEEYFYAYQESAQASDDILRGYLGWERFMSLSAEGIQQAHSQLATERATAAGN